MKYKLNFNINFRKITIASIIIIGIVPLVINSRNKSLVNEWRARYNIDDQHIFTQDLKRGIASFICYLLMSPDASVTIQANLDDIEPIIPTEQQFNNKLQYILTTYKSYPNDFKLALTKLFKDSYTQSQKTGTFDKDSWQKSLKQYYKVIYVMLDPDHKTFSYGPAHGSPLPRP